MKRGDLIQPIPVFRDSPHSRTLGLVTGEEDEHGRKVIMWHDGHLRSLEYWEEKYYEVIQRE